MPRVHGTPALHDGDQGGGEGDTGQLFRAENFKEAAECQGSEDCCQGATNETQDEEYG